MATVEQLENGLRKAHAAGNADHARRFAAEIRKLRQTPGGGESQSQADRYADLQRRAAELPQYDPTDGNSFLQNAAEGIGKSLADTGQGIGQLFGQVSAEEVEERRRRDAPLMNTGGGFVGNVAGQAAQMAVPVGGLARGASLAGRAAPYVGAAARGAAFGATQGVGEGETRGGNAAVSGAFGVAGQGFAAGVGRLAKGAASRLTETGEALARKADDFGIRLGVPNLSTNPLVRTVASQMERLPFSGAGKRNAANQEAFNRKVGEQFGAKDADRITPDVFAKAKTALQNKFEELSSRNDLSLSTEIVGELKQITDEAARLGGNDTARMVRGWVNELIDKVNDVGAVPGKAYQSFDSRLGKVLKSGGEPANYLGRIRDAVRGAMDDSISAADRAAWALVRKQYAALKTVEPLVAKAVDGNIPPSQLMGRVSSDGAGKVRMATGKTGALGDLARIGQQYMKAAPNSGTADRLAVNAVVGGGLYGLQGMGVISPETAAYVGAGLAGNRAALSALNSRALSMGGSRTLNGLARLAKPAPRLLPASVTAAGGLDVTGGRVATQDEIERDAEIVRQFRAKQRAN